MYFGHEKKQKNIKKTFLGNFMGFKDFLGKKKAEASQKYGDFKQKKAEEREFNRQMKDVEANERKSSYEAERRTLAAERGRSAGREQARRPSIRDRVVGGLMGSGESKGGGFFKENFVDVNAPNPRTSESHLSGGLENAMFGAEKKSGKSPIEAAMFGGGKSGTSQLEKAFNFGGGRPRRHHKRRK